MAWYDEVFDGKYDRFISFKFTPEEDQKEAEFIRKALKLRPGEEVLDLACGWGRHAIPLARRGIRITGLDCTERYIEKARRRAGDLPAEFVVGDMREIDWEERFDAAYCFFTSFGFFDDETNSDVLRRISRALKPGGRFLIDTQNRELWGSDDPGFQEFIEFEKDGRQYAIVNDSDFDVETSRVNARLRLYGDPEGPEEMCFSVRLYSLAELRWLMRQAGLEVSGQYGGSDASTYTIKSQRMVVVAEKRAVKDS
jgi:SAM-dependent methyltransferase